MSCSALHNVSVPNSVQSSENSRQYTITARYDICNQSRITGVCWHLDVVAAVLPRLCKLIPAGVPRGSAFNCRTLLNTQGLSQAMSLRCISWYVLIVHVFGCTLKDERACNLLMLTFKKIGPRTKHKQGAACLLYTSPSPRDATLSRMPSSA